MSHKRGCDIRGIEMLNIMREVAGGGEKKGQENSEKKLE